VDTIELGILTSGKYDACDMVTEEHTGNIEYWDDPSLELMYYRDAYRILVKCINEAIGD